MPNLIYHSSQYTHISQGKCLYRLYFLCYTCDPAAQQEFCMSFPTACMACRPFILKVRVRGGMVLHDPHHCMFSVRQLHAAAANVCLIHCLHGSAISFALSDPLPPLPQFSPLSKSCEMVHPIIIRVLILLYWGVARWLAQVAVATDSPPVSLSE